MTLLDARNQAWDSAKLYRRAGPAGGRGLPRPPAGVGGCRGLRAAAPEKKCKKNLTSPCKAVIFPRKLRIVFQTRGKTRGEKRV